MIVNNEVHDLLFAAWGNHHVAGVGCCEPRVVDISKIVIADAVIHQFSICTFLGVRRKMVYCEVIISIPLRIVSLHVVEILSLDILLEHVAIAAAVFSGLSLGVDLAKSGVPFQDLPYANLPIFLTGDVELALTIIGLSDRDLIWRILCSNNQVCDAFGAARYSPATLASALSYFSGIDQKGPLFGVLQDTCGLELLRKLIGFVDLSLAQELAQLLDLTRGCKFAHF